MDILATPSTSEKPPLLSLQARTTGFIVSFPWWILIILVVGSFLGWNIFTDDTYSAIVNTLVVGLVITIRVTLIAYVFAITIGLFTALGQLSDNFIIRNITTLYVQIVRGVPILVQIFYVALVLVPASMELLGDKNWYLPNWLE